MRKILLIFIIILAVIFIIAFFKCDSNPKCKYGADIILPISDTSLWVLFNEHKNYEVYAGSGERFQYWSEKPIEGYITSAKQIILTRKEIYDLIDKGNIRINRDDKKILIQRIYGEYNNLYHILVLY